MKKTIFAAALAVASVGSASASVITWDFGNGFNSTGQNDTMTFVYNSQSLVQDKDNNGILSDGDVINSVGGFGPSGFNSLASPLVGGPVNRGLLGANFVNGFAPDGAPSPTGYNSNPGYVFTFFFNDLVGKYSSAVNNFVYSSGTINFGVWSFGGDTGFAANTFSPLFNFDISSGGPGSIAGELQQSFTGSISSASFANGAGSKFSLTNGATSKTLDQWVATGSLIQFDLSQTVKAGLRGITAGQLAPQFVDGVALLGASHDGSVTISVPEPTSLAILGAGLLGAGFASRRRREKTAKQA